MGARIDSAPALLGGATIPTEATDWTRAAPRVLEYLTALGVRDRLEIDRLSEQVRLRLEVRATHAALEDAVEAAIEETLALIDQWLAVELGIDGDANALATARAAALGGTIPGWSARWAGLAGDSLAPAIRALQRDTVPEFAPLTMQASTIELCCHRLRRRIADAICRLFCQPDLPTNPRGDRS
ncbi:hypothetical protein [Thiocystis violascens]|uniref:Uncharacterized protein n=1 Tax=Thiocystis violascens (strain ATCC 17096 / DSM 198 / 6111) TaxID=765911 RepID=I3Y8I0_THIV6|nr:hypothetical protein [Thiocystis violascens]AFL73298.1 hypothetical protein Thivi_1277 [Thiocystis violascens DSM 198]